jgi:hypothetical protein
MINSEDMETREPSPMVTTKLYKHQKQALWFMWDKEQDWQGEEGDKRKDTLWQPKYRASGEKYYLHVVRETRLAEVTVFANLILFRSRARRGPTSLQAVKVASWPTKWVSERLSASYHWLPIPTL